MHDRHRVTSKGQVTIPKSVRDRLGLRAGDAVEFIEDERGVWLRRRIDESPFANYRGYLTAWGGHTPEQVIDDLRGAADDERP